MLTHRLLSPCIRNGWSASTQLKIAILALVLLQQHAKSGASCLVQLDDPEINKESSMVATFNPSSYTANVETGIRIVLPAAMGFSFTQQNSACVESNPALATSSFIGRAPKCDFFYDTATATLGNVWIQITNLATSTQPFFYGIRIPGLKNGPSATSVDPGSAYCTSYINNGFVSNKDQAIISSLAFTPVTLTSGVSISAAPPQNNAVGTITISFTVQNPIPIQGSMNMQFPAQNTQINSVTGLSTEGSKSILPSSSSELSATGSFKDTLGATTTLNNLAPDSIYVSEPIGDGQNYSMNLRLGNTAIIPLGSVVTIILKNCIMPPTLATLTGFFISSQDQFFNKIDIGPELSLTNTAPGSGNSGSSKATITSNQGVLEKDSTYSFLIYTTGNIPKNGYFTLKVPLSVGLPAEVASMIFVCTSFCYSENVSPSLDPTDMSSRTLLFQGVYPFESAYLGAPGPIEFTLKGFTNPASTSSAFFQWTSYAVIDGKSYKIDQMSTLSIQAVQGACSITKMYATDGNTMIYGVAANWTVTMSCEHPIATDYGLVMTFPTDLLVISTTNCEVGLQNSGYSCVADNTARTVTLFAFTNSVISAGVPFTFTFNSIRNSPVTGLSYKIDFQTKASSGGSIDLGSYTIPKNYFTYGTIWKFSVVPSSQGVGQYPVFYNFTVQPSGEIPVGAYFELVLPPTVVVYDERAIESQCSYGLSGFTSASINCQVNAQTRVITILTGFQYQNTTNMLKGNAMVPPTIKFSIPQLLNPRTMTYTEAFAIKIYNSAGIAIYTWNNTYYVTQNGVFTTDVKNGPVAKMSTPAVPQSVVYTRQSTQNGNLTTYSFTVTPTNFATEGDQITLTMPYPVFFTQQSQVLGVSSNLRYNLTAKVSLDLTTIVITMLMPIKSRMLQQGGSLYVIKSGEAFQFNITNIRNPVSYMPTTQSIAYSVATSGNMIEQLTYSPQLQITNNKPGLFNVSQTSFIPQDFRPSFSNNYTLTLKPINYEQNMKIVVTLPKEISLASNSIACIGIAGTDVQSLTCSLNITAKIITITNAVTFQKANPGTIKIMFSQLKNPATNIVTSSLQVQTYTANGFLMDDLSTGLSINFFCQFPCQNCDSKINSQCTQCYVGGDYAIFFNSTCLLQCPVGYVNTTTNNCTACVKPCATCKNDKFTCTTCISGYRLARGNKCVEIVVWPFPFAILGIVCFFVVVISEIVTKTASKFKEAFMSLLSLAEVGSWITLTVFLYSRLGYQGLSFIACAAAVLIQLLINFIFIGIHQRLIIPNCLTSYRRVLDEHKLATYTLLAVSYLFSYRLSLLSVSNLFKKPVFAGDFSLLNQRHFNRLSLVYILLPYPTMMLSIAYFVYTDGIFSYAGFLGIEVVAISTVMFCMTAVDAMSGCRCNIPRERKAYQTSKVTQGADYESEDEQPGKRLVKRRKDGADEFGADEDIQNEASDTMGKLKGTQIFDVRSNASIVDEETKKQIAMLEELARQMREEKEQLRLEKDRIERERHLMLNDKDQQLKKMQNYLSEYQNQTQLLKGQVDSIQKSKASLVTQVQDKLNEGVEHNKRLLEQQMQQQRLLAKKAYKDIEGEMEDYDPVDEAEQDDEESVIEEAAELPQPVAGQINYFRRMDGDEQYWLQQITPRAGGDSIMGQHDRDDEGQYQVMANKVAHYDTGTVPPSRHNREEYMMRSDASYSQINMVRLIEDAEIYRHQGDAEMEVDSDRGGANSVQEYFQNENAHFDVEDPRTPLTQKVQYMEKEQAEFETLNDKMTRNGSERQFLAQEQAAKGETDPPRSQYAASTQQYLKNEDAAYGNLAVDGTVLREGSPQQFFNGDTASAGRGTEYDRVRGETQQQFMQREAPVYKDNVNSTRGAETNQHYMEMASASRNNASSWKTKEESAQMFMEMIPATRDNASGLMAKEDDTQAYQLDRASQGRASTILRSHNEQAIIGQSADFGKTGEYNRKVEATQNFRPVQQVLEDQSGHSESSEGIVDHNPFSQAKEENIVNKQQAKQQARQQIKQEIRPSAKPEVQKQPQLTTGKKKKTIIYSDKSESSIDDMMGDTPSNYNIPNGRLDGKSLGLKAILLHAQNHTGRDLDNAQRKAGGSPRVAQSNNQFGAASRTNESEERKFVNNLHQRQAATLDTSHDGGWGNLNQPIGSKRTQVIGEESADERTSGQQKKKPIKTNKQFAEPAPGRGGVNGIPKVTNQTPKLGQQQPQLNKVKTNNFL